MKLRGLRRRYRTDDLASSAPDRGFSLVEVVITIALMGTVLLTIMDASIAGIKASTSATDLAQIETVLQNAADRVNRAPLKCNYDQYVKAAAQAAHWDPAQATATYWWYSPGVDATASGTWHTPVVANDACSTPGVAGKDVQLVKITIASPNGRVTRSMQVVKSNV
ncbi:MAG TPA: type II secretion system protein [Ilumatobacteraceae bacterium]|jgi:prepilin-type N-terminal cleavage/methylation domain-containing protein|nr:type II secretion system protein [Ilumatobacteraceae bacterium]